MNILLIGLDSRKDQDGNDLPNSILKQLHAGDSDDGGYNTNTLILVHVSADNKVVAFSIPRDDWVAWNGVPGYNHIKIKEAYGLTKQYVAQKLVNQGVEQPEGTRDEGTRSRPGGDVAGGAQPDRGTDRLFRRDQLGRLLRFGPDAGRGERLSEPRRLRLVFRCGFSRRTPAAECLRGAGVCPAATRPG